MPTFIDESGDTGLIKSGGKPYFRLAAVWVPDEDGAVLFRESIRSLRRDLGLKPAYEFKFCTTHQVPVRRKAFFDVALAQEFRFAVSSIDKTHPDWIGSSGREQHQACATELAALMRPVYCQAEQRAGTKLKERIVVDDNHDRQFLQAVQVQFRGLRSPASPTDSMIGKVSFRKSAPEELLQLVDMVCGAVGEFLDESDPTWYGPIACRDVGRIWLPSTPKGHSDQL